MNIYPVTLENPETGQRVSIDFQAMAHQMRRDGWREVPSKVPKGSNLLAKKRRRRKKHGDSP